MEPILFTALVVLVLVLLALRLRKPKTLLDRPSVTLQAAIEKRLRRAERKARENNPVLYVPK